MPSLKLISLNIERSKHLDRIVPFLHAEHPDVVCLQEVCERDIPRLEETVGTCHAFAPICMHPADPPEEGFVVIGTGIFSRLTARRANVSYYRGNETHARAHRRPVMDDVNLVVCDFEMGGGVFRIGTTHFTWAPDGNVSDRQRHDMPKLLGILDTLGGFVLTGDFNAPRLHDGHQGEIFGVLAARFEDNIPAEYTTSIDGTLHRAGPLPYMIDGLFSTPEYAVSNVRLVDGVRDHMAVVATVSKS